MMTKKLTALTKEPKKRNDADICALPDGAHGFGGPVLDVRCGGKDRRWSCKVVLNGNRITVQLGTVEELLRVNPPPRPLWRKRAALPNKVLTRASTCGLTAMSCRPSASTPKCSWTTTCQR